MRIPHPTTTAFRVNEADLVAVVTHQRNHLRKEALRRQTDAYDAEIKSKIRQISDTRKDLLKISAYKAADGPVREVDVEELLRYAKFISTTTVPPTVPKQEVVRKEEEGKKAAQLTSGMATTPAADTQSQPQEQTGTTATTAVVQGEEPSSESKYIPPHLRGWIGQQLRFEPWPEHLTIQRGALGAIQRIVEAGEDPAGVLSAEERAEVERARAEEEERERVEAEERERRWRAGGGGRRRETVEEVFDPDEI